RVETKENRAVAVPRSPDGHSRSGQGPDQTAIEIKTLQQPVRKKADGTAIWRPERKHSASGSGERARGAGVNGAKPDVRLATGVGDKQNLASIGRQSDRCKRELVRCFRRRDVKPYLRCRGRPAAEPHDECPNDKAQNGDKSCPQGPRASGFRRCQE